MTVLLKIIITAQIKTNWNWNKTKINNIRKNIKNTKSISIITPIIAVLIKLRMKILKRVQKHTQYW